MVYGIAKMLNFAHGDIIMVGGFTICVFCSLSASLPMFFAAVILSVLFCVLLGVTVEKVAYKPLRGASPLAVLITAIGISSLLQSLAQIIFGSAARRVSVPSLHSARPDGAAHRRPSCLENCRRYARDFRR